MYLDVPSPKGEDASDCPRTPPYYLVPGSKEPQTYNNELNGFISTPVARNQKKTGTTGFLYYFSVFMKYFQRAKLPR